jgi:voltage-gated potassium channel
MFGIEEVRIGELSSLAGKTIQENNLRSCFDVTVLAVLRGNVVIHNPAGQEMLQEHDMIIVFGPAEKLKLLEKACQKI